MLDRAPPEDARADDLADRRLVGFRGAGFTPRAGRISGWIALALVIALWQLAGSAGWVNPLFLPPPSAIALAIYKLAMAEARLLHWR
jgi:ABC-type nitrate/sulfonate/bicarbonate transport system permease component